VYLPLPARLVHLYFNVVTPYVFITCIDIIHDVVPIIVFVVSPTIFFGVVMVIIIVIRVVGISVLALPVQVMQITHHPIPLTP